MRSVLLTLLLLACCSVATQAQSCLTQDDVRQMLARIETPPPATPDKKLIEELFKITKKERELLQQVVEKDQKSKSDKEKLHKLYEEDAAKLCQILKANGWPTTARVTEVGVYATFQILKNAGTFELQRDLLPVIVAAIKKDPVQKREFAGLYDRLRVSAGLKQLFGTQAVSMGGFLVLYPIEDQATSIHVAQSSDYRRSSSTSERSNALMVRRSSKHASHPPANYQNNWQSRLPRRSTRPTSIRPTWIRATLSRQKRIS